MTETAVLICQPDAGLGASTAPCVDVNGVHSAPALLESYTLTPEQGAFFESINSEFDYGLAAQFFAYAFMSVVGLWLFCKLLGTMMQTLRNNG